MNKQDVVAKIAKDTGLTKTAAAGVIASLIESITKSLKKGDPVSFVGFGTFKTANRKARSMSTARFSWRIGSEDSGILPSSILA